MKKQIILSIITIMILSACQPSPKEEIVISKSNNRFEEALKESNIEENEDNTFIEKKNIKLNYPSTWEAYYEKYKGKLIIDVNAEIIIGDGKTYSVETIKPYYVPIEQANKIIYEIYGTLDVYNVILEVSKSQIEDLIVQVKADIQDAKNTGNEEIVLNLEGTLKDLYANLKTAPEEVEATKYGGEYTLFTEDGYNEQYILLREDPYNVFSPALEIHNIIESRYGNGYDSIITYDNISKKVNNYVDSNTDKIEFEKNPIFNTENAKNAIIFAKAFLDNIGIEDRVLENIVARSSEENPNTIAGYLMYFGKKYNNTIIPLFTNLGGSASKSEENYIQPLMPETLKVEVSDNKITYFEWSNMYEIKDSLSNDIELLSFDSIISNFETQLAAKYAYLENIELPYKVYIDKIYLTYSVQPIKNKKYEYMLIPVWAFYGGYDYGEEGYELSDGTIRTGRYIEPASLLTINAVDGTVITLN